MRLFSFFLASRKRFILFLVITISSSCTHDNYILPDGGTGGTGNGTGDTTTPVPCVEGTIYFSRDIFPLINTTCAISKCHDDITQRAGVVLTSYTKIMKYVSAGKPGSSKLFEVVTTTGGDKMPRLPAEPWTNAQIDLLKKWIEQGAKNNSCNSCNPDEFKFTATIKPLIDQKCKGCHNSNLKSGNIDLSAYSGIRAVALDGRLKGAITWSAGYSKMPAAQKLPDCEITQIVKWIDAGSIEN